VQAERAERQERTATIVVALAERHRRLAEAILYHNGKVQLGITDEVQLGEAYKVDRAAVESRRVADHGTILAGQPITEKQTEPVLVYDVLQAAGQEVHGDLVDDSLQRVRLRVQLPAIPESDVETRRVELEHEEIRGIKIKGPVAMDVVHIVSVLIENGLGYSPATEVVEVTAGLVARGLLITVVDHGVGMHPKAMDRWNDWLRDRGTDILSVDTGRLGLAVVARLAALHEIDVRLTPTPGHGLTAGVVLPYAAVTGLYREQVAGHRQPRPGSRPQPHLGTPPPGITSTASRPGGR
jgi:signal transduction histidine kinase